MRRISFHLLTSVSFLLVSFTIAFAQPTITSFAPTSGASGTTVTINGTNFNTTTASNIVFFGATKASITSASTTQLTVTVPVGATFAPIVILNSATGLLAHSKTNFTPTFTPNKGSIAVTDFDAKVDFTAGTSPFFVSVGDLDGDGKADMVVANYKSNNVSVYRNTGSNGLVSFAAKQDFATGTGPIPVAIGDLDGDGKADLAVANYDVSTISLLRNTSTSGTINFASKVDLTTLAPTTIMLSIPLSISIGDLDGDGKADLAVVNSINSAGALVPCTTLVFRNTSTLGSITASSFATPVQFNAGIYSRSIALGDLDGDGKVDMAIANYTSAASTLGTVSVLRNTSSPSKITFDPTINFPAGNGARSVAIGDLDGDGKLDLAVANYLVNNVSVFRNTSTSGSITASSFATKVDFTTGTSSNSVALGDLNGDGKVDLAVANYAFPTAATSLFTVSILRNSSTSGSITASSFATKVDLQASKGPLSVAIGDLDGDGRPDVALANDGDGTVSVIHNNPVLPLSIISFTTTTGPVGTTVTIIGTGFSSTPGNNIVTFNGTQAVVTASTSTSMTVTVPTNATTGAISVSVGGVSATSSNVFTVTTSSTVDPNGLIVYNAVAPDSNYDNKFFRLENIEKVSPRNEVIIYNRWGDEVFTVTNYTNADNKKRFEGLTNSGNKLPSGTYFYKINLTETSKTVTGFLVLKY